MMAHEKITFPPTIFLVKPNYLGESGSLEAVINILLRQGFRIFQVRSNQVLGDIGSWKPNVESIYQDLLPLAYERRYLHLAITDNIRNEHLQLRFDLTWHVENGQICNQRLRGTVAKGARTLFNQKVFDPSYYTQRLVDLSKELYDALHPDFGWLDRCRSRGYTTDEAVSTLTLPHLYWANFFGPTYVEAIGEEFLLHAHGGVSERLQDGGILFRLDSGFKNTSQRKHSEEAAKRYFSIS